MCGNVLIISSFSMLWCNIEHEISWHGGRCKDGFNTKDINHFTIYFPVSVHIHAVEMKKPGTNTSTVT